MVVAIILAGGKGVRAKQNMPKQFVEVLGKPVIAYTLDIFQNHREIDAIEIVCISGYIDHMWDIVHTYHMDKVKWIVEGGSDVQQSAMNGIKGLESICADDDIVVFHTGAAPFLEEEILTDSLKVCKEKGNSITGFSLHAWAGLKNDTETDCVKEWFDRDRIICLKNPQSLHYGFIRDLYKKATEMGVIGQVAGYITALMSYMHEPIYLSKGTQNNIKITTQDDFDFFEGYLLMKEKRARDCKGECDAESK